MVMNLFAVLDNEIFGNEAVSMRVGKLETGSLSPWAFRVVVFDGGYLS